MKIAVAGLGRMGMQIARKLSENGHDVIAHNRSSKKVDEAVTYGAAAAYEKVDVVEAFAGSTAGEPGEQLILWLMVPADTVDVQLDEWLGLIPKGSIIIDGGNSDFRQTQKRAVKVSAAGSTLFDSGTSGGVWGYQNGFSMMVGGGQSNDQVGEGARTDKNVFSQLEPIFKTLAAPRRAYQHFGPSGSGHYVKMVHNAVEYGMMESLAEGYRMLREGPYQGLDLAAAGEVWQHGSVVSSWLNELCRDALKESPNLDGIEGYVAESGEARWTLEVAREMNISLPSIQASFDVRLASQKGETNFATKMLSAMRNKFGGHQLNK